VIRIIATFLSVSFTSFDLKEKVFLCVTWIPKATVQAAVGSIALDLARDANNSTYITLASNVLNIAVLSIVVTVPIGTILISLLATRLLTKTV
jgi:NhaP-type Na+/H+ or K+/H+ antiporter